jgi:chemotaxis protein MotB
MSQSKFSKPDSEPPIRIVKKKVGHAGHHGGAWKVAYADFVTAMMALFIVLWIVGQSKQVKEYVAGYFKDPGAFFANTKGGGPFEASKIGLGVRGVDEEMLRHAEQEQQKAFQSMGKQIMGNLASSKELKHLAGQIDMKIVRDGLRIELLEQSESFFFDVGTAALKADAQEVLGVIAKEVGRLPNHLIIEGHTDSRPYSRADGYSNFELSAERANSARRTLVTRGVDPAKVDEVRGYADTHLRNSEDPFDVTNRRISILVKFMGE